MRVSLHFVRTVEQESTVASRLDDFGRIAMAIAPIEEAVEAPGQGSVTPGRLEDAGGSRRWFRCREMWMSPVHFPRKARWFASKR